MTGNGFRTRGKPTRSRPSCQVNAERIAAWYQVLDEADAILDGEKLIPHWRFEQGINLRRVFEEPQPFDLVLWITGPAALPYLEDGPVTTPEEWDPHDGGLRGKLRALRGLGQLSERKHRRVFMRTDGRPSAPTGRRRCQFRWAEVHWCVSAAATAITEDADGRR